MKFRVGFLCLLIFCIVLGNVGCQQQTQQSAQTTQSIDNGVYQNTTSGQSQSPGQSSQPENIASQDQTEVEQLIKSYFRYLEQKNYAAAWELMSSNSQKYYPEEEAIKNHFGIESLKLISIKTYKRSDLLKINGNPPNTPNIIYEVELNIVPSQQSAWNNGINERYVGVVKENGEWKISGLATSP